MATRPYDPNRAERDRTSHGSADRHRSSNYLYKYYDDMGYIGSESQHAAWVKGNEDYAVKWDAAKGELTTAQGKVTDAKSKWQAAKDSVPGLDAALSEAWDTARKDWIDIDLISDKIVDGQYQVQRTYRLPIEVARELAYNGEITSNWHKDENRLSVSTIAGGEYVAEELHASLLEAETTGKNQFYEASMPALAKQLEETSGILNDSWTQIQATQDEVDEAQGTLDGYSTARKEGQQDVRDDFQERLQTMREVLGGLNVETRGTE